MKRRLFAIASVTAALGVVALARQNDAGAQRVDPRRAATFVVGPPGGPMPMQRVDSHRSGAAKQPLPSAPLQVAWRKTIGLSIDQPALASSDGTLAVVTARGDVVFLDESGDEKAHVTVDGRSAGPAAMTSDGTIVFATSSGDAVGVRRSSLRPRYVSRIGGERNVRAAPLALDDGGVVVATMTDLVVLDAEGNVRTRATLPDGAAAPLIAWGDKVLAITTAGTVYGWTPGREPARLGSFGAPIDGGAALDGSTLIAVIEGNHLVDLDIVHGARGTRSIAAQGLYLGPPAVRRGANGATLATVLSMTPTRVAVTTLDSAGAESGHAAPIASLSTQLLPDGGTQPLVAPLHTGPLVDARGVVAYAGTDGHVGVITSEGAVEQLGEVLCSRTGRSAGITGLTPVARGAFVVTCDSGTVARVQGPDADPMRKSPTPANKPSGTASPPRPGQPPPPEEDDDNP